jgi:uncharacterized protein YdeI (YjbR/CyaY-like superfamily)
MENVPGQGRVRSVGGAVKPTFFRNAAAFRRWLEAHHDGRDELVVGFHRMGSGKPGITYPEALDEALCFGWIDGVRRTLDGTSYTIRFTPRRPRSIWSRVNIERVGVLAGEGRMRPAGIAAFERRDETKTDLYSYEARSRGFDEKTEQLVRADPRAWAFFRAQSPWFQRNVSFWVMSAKREETRMRRLASLIEDMRNERIPPALARPSAGKGGRARE